MASIPSLIRRLMYSATLTGGTLASLHVVSQTDALAGSLSRHPAAVNHTVKISSYLFRPKALTIRVGDSVTWKNIDADTHTATSNSRSASHFDTGSLASGISHRITFKHAGTLTYHCAYHSFMHGTIKVLAKSSS